MKNRLYRVLAVLLCVCFFMPSVPIFAEEYGQTGKTKWSIDSSGKLTVSGTGITEYTTSGSFPVIQTYPLWYDRAAEIKSMEIKSGITGIDSSAFVGCVNLESLSIPDTVTSIKFSTTFSVCENLKSITVDSNNQYYSVQDNVLFNKDKTVLVYYPCGLDATEYTVPSGTKEISSHAFDGSRISDSGIISFIKVEKVILPEGLETIADHAFYHALSLNEATLPEGLKEIGASAFFGCGLENVILPDSVEAVGNTAFASCDNLKSIHIPSTTASIGTGIANNSSFEYICSDSADCPAQEYAETNGFEFVICENGEPVKKELLINGGVKSLSLRGQNPDTVQLSLTSDGESCDCSGFTFESSNTKIAEVNENGVVSAVHCGSAVITVSKEGYASATVAVNVGHTYTSETVKATCKEKGYTLHTCSECGNSYTTNETPLAPHDFVYEATTAPTCMNKGFDTFICSVCGAEEQRNFTDTAEHKYEAAVTAPTEEAGGYTTYTCSVCGDSYTADETEKLPHKTHKFVFSETVAPTCTERGYDIYACSVCGLQRQSNYTQARGHDYEDGICVDCGKVQAWEYVINGASATITGVDSNEAQLRIPSTLEGVTVEAIGAYALTGIGTVKYVYIPDSVKSIEDGAFTGFTALNEVYIGKNAVSIGSGAFSDCPALSLVCTDAESIDIAANAFENSNSRLTFISREGSSISEQFAQTGKPCITYAYPLMRDDKKAIDYHGNVIAYQDLEYHYWNETARRYTDASYMHFDSLEIQGIGTSEVVGKISENHYDAGAANLTLKDIYISISLDGEEITFDNLSKKLKDGYSDLLITFDDTDGGKLTVLQRIGQGIMQVLKTLTKLLNSIIKAFKK